MSLNFNFNRKNLSSEEISSHMDFREVLSNYQVISKPFYKTTWFGATVGVTLATIATLVILNTTTSNENQNQANQNQKNETPIGKTVTYKEDSPCIVQPKNSPGVEFATYKINNETGGTIIHPSGSKLEIPKEVFVLNGKKVEGEVEIQYREFRDAADFIAAGIPMTYDSAGTRYHFESAGMLEIRAYKNGEPVALEGEIAVTMMSDYSESKYNLYVLNEEKKNWECIGKDKVNKMNEPEKGSDNSLEFVQRKEIQKMEDKIAEVKKEIVQIKNEKPLEPNKRNMQNYSFTVDVLADEFPEMSVFKGQRFEVPVGEKGFHPDHFNTEWEDIRIDKSSKGDLKMTLAKNWQKKTFSVYPVFEGSEYAKKKEEFDSKVNLYSSRLEQKEKEEKDLEQKLAAIRKETHRKSKELSEEWAKNKPKFELVEMKNIATPDERYESNFLKMKNNNRMVNGALFADGYAANRTFNIPSLGVVNCDNPVKLPIKKKGKKHKLNFFRAVGQSIILGKIFVIEKVRNVMFTYTGSDINDLRLNANDEIMLVGITGDGDIAILSQSEMKKIDLSKDELDLVFDIKKNIESVDMLRNLINS